MLPAGGTFASGSTGSRGGAWAEDSILSAYGLIDGLARRIFARNGENTPRLNGAGLERLECRT